MVIAAPAPAQVRTDGPYQTVHFNPHANLWIVRVEGTPWICAQGARCEPLKLAGIADIDLATTRIMSLGFAERASYLSVQHPRYFGARTHVFRCEGANCTATDLEPGEFTFLGTFPLEARTRQGAFTMFLAKHDLRPSLSRLIQCSDRNCRELPLTRENNYDFVYLGTARFAGYDRFWLRERSGAVWSCAKTEANSDRLVCGQANIAFPELPALAGTTQPPVTQPPSVQPPVTQPPPYQPPVTQPPPYQPPVARPPITQPPVTQPDPAEAAALARQIEDAFVRGALGEAQRLIAEGQLRHPNQIIWAQLDARLQQLRSERTNRLRAEQAQRLVADSRQRAGQGDFAGADTLLQEAERLAPNLPEVGQARAEVARLRAEQERRHSERTQLIAAIEQALSAFNLFQAETLIRDAERRFAGDAAIANFRTRLNQLRAEAETQQRVQRARDLIAAARQAMERGDYAEAERLLTQAEQAAPGYPETRQAQADFARQRAEAETQRVEVRQVAEAIEAALKANRLRVAEQLLSDAKRRHPRHAAWGPLEARLEQLKRETAQVRQLVIDARAAIQRKDFAAAEALIIQAENLDKDSPEVRGLRGEFEAAKRPASGLEGLDDAKLRAKWYEIILGQIPRGMDRYKAAQGNKAIAYCVDWANVGVETIPTGPFGLAINADSEAAAQTQAMTACNRRDRALACECVLTSSNGRNVLKIPDQVLKRFVTVRPLGR
jgi:hypothetical protein